MQTPIARSMQVWLVERRAWLNAECLSDPKQVGAVVHKCGAKLRAVDVRLDIHLNIDHMCAGSGEELRTYVPYCKACEETPQPRGCLHV